MKEAFRLSMALGIICAVASGVLAVANEKTREAQERAVLAERSKAIFQVLPGCENQPLKDSVNVPCDGGTATFYRARQGGRIISIAGQGKTTQGFGGDVEALAAMTPDGTITAVVVTNHTETPGLGTKATDRKVRKSLWQLFSGGGGEETSRTLPPSSYLDQYQRGLSAADAPFKVRGDGGRIDAVSGATISSRAVADAVSVVCQAFEKNRDTILQ